MTRKDYIIIANEMAIIRKRAETKDGQDMWRECVEVLSSAMHRDNPNFDKARFIAACEVKLK